MEKKKINIPKITIHSIVTITQLTPPLPPSSSPTPACLGILKYFGGVRTPPHPPLDPSLIQSSHYYSRNAFLSKPSRRNRVFSQDHNAVPQQMACLRFFLSALYLAELS